MDCSTPGFPVHHQLPELAQTQCPSSRWCHPTVWSSVVSFSSCLQSPSISVFSNESAFYIRWPKYWSFSFSISPSNEYWELISFRIDWFDLLAVQGILRSLLQHHISKSSTWQIHGIFVFLAFDACPRWGVQVFIKCIQTPCDTKITTQILLYTFEKVYPLQLSSKVEVAK